ncbi:MAG TPA: hypothetical protein VKA49_17990 [Flavitalea sp.]|nr:hypothetical protein [Flavitalea sp.]
MTNSTQYLMVKSANMYCFMLLLTTVLLGHSERAQQLADRYTSDPLPSWQDGNVKQSIIAYVNKVNDSTANDFIPVADRIATFDNDGTLWG